MMTTPKLQIAALLMSLAAGAHAQAIYRCGDTYSQTACPRGRVVEASDPRSAAQQAEARRVAADERRLGFEMARERRAEQAALKPALASGFNSRSPLPEPTAAPVAHAKKKPAAHKRAPTTDFVAQVPGSRQRRGRG